MPAAVVPRKMRSTDCLGITVVTPVCNFRRTYRAVRRRVRMAGFEIRVVIRDHVPLRATPVERRKPWLAHFDFFAAGLRRS